MSSANASPGGPRPAQPASPRRSGESQTRVSPRTPSVPRAHDGWARCEDDAPAEAPAPAPRVERSSPAEPRTGVVRRIGAIPSARVASRAPEAASRARAEPSRAERGAGASDWRCLEEWSQPAKERRSRRNAKVTIAQLSRSGDLVRQNGPDAWLPEAGDFLQRMSRLLAQGLGFERCRSLCLKGPSAVLTVTEAGDSKVVAVSGPLRSMTNVLRRAGLE